MSGQTVRCGAPRPLASLSFHRRTKNKMKSRFAIHDCQVKNHDPLQFQTIIYPGNGHGGHCFPDPMFSSGTPRRGNKKMPDWLGLHVWFGLLGWLGLFGLLGLLGLLGCLGLLRLLGWLAGWLARWLAGWLVGSLAGQLDGWPPAGGWWW